MKLVPFKLTKKKSHSLKILSKSKKWHGDGLSFARFFAQLYVIHAFFMSRAFDKNKDNPFAKSGLKRQQFYCPKKTIA